MSIVNSVSGTRVDEVADGVFRISTPAPNVAGGFSFNQYLVTDDEPLLFHTGGRKLSAAVRAAIGQIIPIDRLRWIGFSHHESDESGGMNELLAAAPHARPLCSMVGAMVQMVDLADHEPRGLADGETFSTGRRAFTWIDTPHLPHGWDCGYLFEATSGTLLCGDLFTQPGLGERPLTDGDILGPSEAFRAQMDYHSHTTHTTKLIEKLASKQPRVLACMHGSAWQGDGAKMLRALGAALDAVG